MSTYGDRLETMNDVVNSACVAAGHTEVNVYYSAYKTVKVKGERLPYNNLRETFAHGTYTVEVAGDDFFGNGDSYKSEPVTDPTWLDLAVLANEAITATGDYHHIFFENAFHVKGQPEVIRLVFGS